MKNLITTHTKAFQYFTIALSVLIVSACSEDDPKKEDAPELITKLTLTFTPQGGGEPVVVTATDPDGAGVQPITVDDDIHLAIDHTYVLTLSLSNTLVPASDPAYDITAEVEEEGDEHMFFFGWTNNVFANPAGNGNLDNRGDAVNYSGADNSLDENGLPLGLTTTWTTALNAGSGDFEIRLKHQPELKSETSTVNDGETDLAITFGIVIEE